MKDITTLCTGCRACEQICGHRAITIQQDKEGFWAPVVDQNLCTDCGLCAARCPQNNTEPLLHDCLAAKAARLKDEAMLYKAASGGAFAGIATDCIRRGWVVFGVRYDKNMVAHHGAAENMEELESLLSSKYVQSDTRHTFTEVKRLLREGRKVLYSGTGCQIGGLKAFLGKEYENLLTIDLVCHGVPSPLLFQRYVECLRRKHKTDDISEYDFRDKSIGWGLDYKYKYKYKYKYGSCSDSAYYMYFLRCETYRECCYQCHYACKKSPADITIADYWGIEYEHPEFNDERGVSLVLLNSERGQKAWELAQPLFESIDSDVDRASIYNINLQHPSPRKAEVRDHVYDGIWDMDAEVYMRTRLPHHITWRARVKMILPAWAMRWIRRRMK